LWLWLWLLLFRGLFLPPPSPPPRPSLRPLVLVLPSACFIQRTARSTRSCKIATASGSMTFSRAACINKARTTFARSSKAIRRSYLANVSCTSSRTVEWELKTLWRMLRVVGVDSGHLERTKLILFNSVTCLDGVDSRIGGPVVVVAVEVLSPILKSMLDGVVGGSSSCCS